MARLDQQEVPGPVKAMLAALTLAVSIAIGIGSYTVTTLAAKVDRMELERTVMAQNVAVSQAELKFLRETMIRMEAALDAYRREVNDAMRVRR